MPPKRKPKRDRSASPPPPKPTSTLPKHLHPKHITLQSLQDLSSKYIQTLKSHPSSKTLIPLDEFRYTTLPARIASRAEPSTSSASKKTSEVPISAEQRHLTRDELVELVRWKLSHGKFRPRLVQLAGENSEEAVRDVSAEAFRILLDEGDDWDESKSKEMVEAQILRTQQLLTLLSKPLKGIGPATASLVLSVGDPQGTVFFSDEVFRWACWDEPGGGGGWGRKIKYDIKEYGILCKQVAALRTRLGDENVSAELIERAAWVLGRGGANIEEAEAEKEKTGGKRTAEEAREEDGKTRKKAKK